jgi:nucleotide-binding universal stress UspA family protein
MFKKIVWANDSSWQAQHALPLVKELAAGGSVKLVVVYAEEGGMLGKLFVEKGEQTPRQLLSHTVEELQTADVDAELMVVRSGAGGQSQAIADAARQIGADLIVAGNAGHGAVGGVVFGSILGRLLNLAPCPVLTVPATLTG